jgi:hypothetical protein
MTILATGFSLVIGAWRLRIRIDIDEPRAFEIDEAVRAAPRGHDEAAYAGPHVAARGRG